MLLYSSIESIHTVPDVTEKYMIYKSVNYLYIVGSVLQWLHDRSVLPNIAKKDKPNSQHIFDQVLFIFLPNIWKMYVESC